MKFTKVVFTILLLVCAHTAFALDFFGAPREATFAWSNCATIGQANYTNGPIDIRKFDGRGRLILFCITNSASAVVTATVQTSTYPNSNWVNSTGIAIATNFLASLTNYYGGVSNVVKQVMPLPGVPTYPAFSSGALTPYLTSVPATNTGALSLNYNAPTVLGLNLDDQAQYLQIVWNVTGGSGATNATVGAELIGNSLYP